MTKGEKIALIGTIANIFLGISKYFLGYLSGSLSLKAEAYHSFLDVLVSLLIFVGLKVSQRKSKNFPFGLYKIENLLSFVIGIIMLLAGFEIVKEAISGSSIIKGERVFFTSAVVLTLAVVNYFWASYKIRIGKEILSPSITSDGYHSRIESFTLLLIALGLMGSTVKNLPIDRVMAILISLSIFKVSLGIIWDAIKILLDGTVEQETYKKIQAILSAHSMVDSISELLIRRSGKFLFIETTITLKCNDINLATQVNNELQETILRSVNNIERITINYVKSTKLIYAVMADTVEGVISRQLAHAPYIFLVKNTAKKSVETISNPILNLEKQKAIKLIRVFKDNSVDMVVTRGVVQNKGIIVLLRNAGINHLSSNCENIDEFLNTFA